MRALKDRAAIAREHRMASAKPAIFVRIDKDIKERLDEACLNCGVTRGDLITRALDFYLTLKLADETPFGKVSKS